MPTLSPIFVATLLAATALPALSATPTLDTLCPNHTCEAPITGDVILPSDADLHYTFTGDGMISPNTATEHFWTGRSGYRQSLTLTTDNRNGLIVDTRENSSWLKILGFKNLTLINTTRDVLNLKDDVTLALGGTPNLGTAAGFPETTLTIRSTRGSALQYDRSVGSAYAHLRMAAKNVVISTESDSAPAIGLRSEEPLYDIERLFSTKNSEHKTLKIRSNQRTGSSVTITAPTVAVMLINEFMQVQPDYITIRGSVQLVNSLLVMDGGQTTAAASDVDDSDTVGRDPDAVELNLFDEAAMAPYAAKGGMRLVIESGEHSNETLLLDSGSAARLMSDEISIIGHNNEAISTVNSDPRLKSHLFLYGTKALNIQGNMAFGATDIDVAIHSPTSGLIDGTIQIDHREEDTRHMLFNFGGTTHFNGAFTVTPTSSGSTDAGTSRIELALHDGASWTLTGDSTVPLLSANGGTIDLNAHHLALDEVAAAGKSLTVKTTSLTAGQINAAKNTSEVTPTVIVDMKAIENAPTGSALVEQLKAIATVTDGEAFKIQTQGLLENGTLDPASGTLTTTTTPVVQAVQDLANQQILGWRTQINDVTKRLGDLRTYEGVNQGGWVRLYGAKQKMKNTDLSSTANTVQIGADTRVAENFYVGLTGTYTDGESKAALGTSDDTGYSVGVYGGWMAENGQFFDVIFKATHVASDFDLRYADGTRSSGNFGAWGTSLSAEYGWRLTLPGSQRFWVEPQAEVSYGYLGGDTYSTSAGVRVKQGSITSVIGRLGVALGTTWERGSAYVKASVAHDWDSESTVTLAAGNNRKTLTDDLGGTWGEFALGGTMNFTKNLAAYAEFQTTVGSPIKTPYQWNLGARYKF